MSLEKLKWVLTKTEVREHTHNSPGLYLSACVCEDADKVDTTGKFSITVCFQFKSQIVSTQVFHSKTPPDNPSFQSRRMGETKP